MNRAPDYIKVLYTAFLKNYNKMSKAVEDYYTDPTSTKRAKLLQELAKAWKGTISQKIIMAEKAMPILDKYNTISSLLSDDLVDIDFNDAELLTLFNKTGLKIK